MIRKSIIVVLTLAAVEISVAWVLSFWGSVGCSFFFGRTQQNLQATCCDGQAMFSLSLYADASDASVSTSLPRVQTGFAFTDEVVEVRYTNRTVYMHIRRIHTPIWAVALLFAAYPLIALIQSPARRRRYRSEHGLCIKCGYDLTGNVSGVCPECGTEIDPR